jgi:hypothetical protein
VAGSVISVEPDDSDSTGGKAAGVSGSEALVRAPPLLLIVTPSATEVLDEVAPDVGAASAGSSAAPAAGSLAESSGEADPVSVVLSEPVDDSLDELAELVEESEDVVSATANP